jgi:FMN reductase
LLSLNSAATACPFQRAFLETTTFHFNAMSYFLAISGSPSQLSRNSFLIQGLERRLNAYGTRLHSTHAIELQPFAAGASDRLAELIDTVHQAQAILLITPVPSEDWTGCMKTLLQFLPAGALQRRPILLIGTGGNADELPGLEKSHHRELARLDARLALSSIHIGPKNWMFSDTRPPWLTAGIELRLNRALDQLHSLALEPVALHSGVF